MKTSNLIALILLFALILPELKAQVPQGIPFQAVARNNQSLLSNQSLDIRFTILEGGNSVYQETHGVQTNQYGLLLNNFLSTYLFNPNTFLCLSFKT